MGSHNGRSFVVDGYDRRRPHIPSSPILEDYRDGRTSVASLSGTQPYRPDSPSSTVGSKTVQFTEKQNRNLRALGDQVRMEMSRLREEPRDAAVNHQRHPSDFSFNDPVRIDTRPFGRRPFAINTEMSPIANTVDGWLQPPPLRRSTTFPRRDFSPPTRQVPPPVTTDNAPPTTSDRAIEANLDRSDDLRRRLIGFRHRVSEIGQQQDRALRDRATSPVRSLISNTVIDYELSDTIYSRRS